MLSAVMKRVSIVAVVMALGCAPVKTMTRSMSDSVVVRETVRDTVIELSPDSSLVRALIECDSLGRARLSELLDYRAGDRISPPVITMVDNILTAKSQVDSFKIYVSDLGLLCAKKDLSANDVLYMVEEINDFKGGMAENYVHVQLTINGYRTYYWTSERGAEIDFVIQREGSLIPIEVKSADNTRAKSLKVYMETYKPDYAIRLSAKNFGSEDGKKIVPLYAAFCI